MAHNILRLPAVKARTGLSRSSIYKFVAEGRFPRAVHIGPRSVGWLEAEIDEWLNRRLGDRSTTLEFREKPEANIRGLVPRSQQARTQGRGHRA